MAAMATLSALATFAALAVVGSSDLPYVGHDQTLTAPKTEIQKLANSSVITDQQRIEASKRGDLLRDISRL